VTLALMVGIAAPAWGLTIPQGWGAATLGLLAAALLVLWTGRRRVRLIPLLFFIVLGMAFYQQAWEPRWPEHHVARLPEGEAITLAGRLGRPTKMAPERVQMVVEADAWLSPQGWRPATGKFLVLAPPRETPPAGTHLWVRGKLPPIEVLQNPGAFRRDRLLAADGIFREMRLQEGHDLVFLASPAAYSLGEQLRGGVRRLLKDMDPTRRALYLAMLLGDQGEVTPQMRQALARTGASHLLVINGLHLGMVAAVTYFICFWLLRRIPWLLLRIKVMQIATVAAAATVVGYAWVAGGSPSTQRAEVMVLAYLFLVFLGRPREIWSALALAALIVLALSPLRLFSISFQLSFVAVAALIYLMPRLLADESEREDAGGWRVWAARLWRWLREWGGASLAASLATAPLVARYFQVVSLFGIVVNLAAIPLVLGLALPLGEAAVLAQALGLTPVAQALLYLGQGPLWLGWQAIAWAAQMPGSAFTAPMLSWGQIGLYYLGLILALTPRRSLWTWAGAGLATLALTLSLMAPAARQASALEVTCLDSHGNLEAVVVAPGGQRLVVSAAAPAWPSRGGAGWGPLPSYCHWRQFRWLDMVLVLNLSQDNAGELLALAEQFHLGPVWFGRRGRQGPAYWELWNFLGDRARTPQSLWRGSPPDSLDGLQLAYWQPAPEAAPALKLEWQGRQMWLFPPWRAGEVPYLGAAAPDRGAVLVLPASLARQPEMAALAARWQPWGMVLYGRGQARDEIAETLPAVKVLQTWEGAATLMVSANGVQVRQQRE
jgi:competence protein ComEC